MHFPYIRIARHVVLRSLSFSLYIMLFSGYGRAESQLAHRLVSHFPKKRANKTPLPCKKSVSPSQIIPFVYAVVHGRHVYTRVVVVGKFNHSPFFSCRCFHRFCLSFRSYSRVCLFDCSERRASVKNRGVLNILGHVRDTGCCAADSHACLQVVDEVCDGCDENEENEDDEEDNNVALHGSGGGGGGSCGGFKSQVVEVCFEAIYHTK